MNRVSAALLAAVTALAAFCLPGTSSAANVGYYEMCFGTGSAAAATAIAAAGSTPVNVTVPDAATLAGLDGLWVTNCNNGGYGGEYLANLTAINNAVQTQGLVLIVHDRFVSGAGVILPGLTGVRDFTDGANIDFPAGSPIITGPAGTLTDASLDGGGFSNHGYIASMPAGGVVLANRNATQPVTVTYPWGNGRVVYSSIPLDAYLGGGSIPGFTSPYAPNVIAWAVPSFTSCAAEGFSGTKLTLCRQVCEMNYTGTKLNALIRTWTALYHQDPPCAR